MIRMIPLICVLVTAALPAADIYRWVDDGGQVIYSDRPTPGAEPLAAPIRAGRSPAQPRPTEEAEPSAVATPEADTGPYEAFEIATPEDGAVVASADGRLDVGLLLIPALLPGERLRVIVDEVPVQGAQPGTQMRLQGLALGTHRLRAEVLDDAGAPIARTATISVHIRPPDTPAGGTEDDAGL